MQVADGDFDIKDDPAINPVGNLFMDIYTDSAGAPGTSIGTSDALAGSSLAGGFLSADFTWSTPVLLTAGTPYWVVVYGDSTYNAGTDHLTLQKPASGAPDGWKFNGSTWATLGSGNAIGLRIGTGQPVNLGQNGSPWNILYVNDINSKVAAETALGTLTWAGGAAPSGTISKTYRAYRLANQVTVTAKITASSAGTAATSVSFPLPAGLPPPATWATQESSGLVVTGTGTIVAALSGASTGGSGLYSDGSGGWVIKIFDLAAVSAVGAFAQVTYYI